MSDVSALVNQLNELMAMNVIGDERCLIASSATWRAVGTAALTAHYAHTDEGAPADSIMLFPRDQCPICTQRSREKYNADGWAEADLECERLREIIVQFGDHLDGCPGRVGDDCTCGYLEALEAQTTRKLFVVIGGFMDYGDRGDVLVGVFNDERRANEVSSDAARAIYDMTRIVPLDLNEVRNAEGE